MACYESGGELVGGQQPEPIYKYAIGVVDMTILCIAQQVNASVKRRVTAQAEAVFISLHM